MRMTPNDQISDDDSVIDLPVDPEHGQLVAAPAEAAGVDKPKSLFEAPKNEKDDSYAAFGNDFVPPMGSADFSPHPGDTDNPLSPEEKLAYEAWLKSSRLTERTRFSQHKQWHDYLKKMGLLDFPAQVTISDIPVDAQSNTFRNAVLAQHRFPDAAPNAKLQSFLGRQTPPDSITEMAVFVPDIIPASDDPDERERSWVRDHHNKTLNISGKLSRYQGAGFDELLMMRDMADENPQLKAGSMTVGKHRMTPGRFIIVSDHDGEHDGTRIYIWTGIKPSFTMASKALGQNINQLKGSDGERTSEFNLDVRHLRLPNLTIIQIADNEVGFCHNRQTSRIEKMLPGRYVLQKGTNFIGKAAIDFKNSKPITLDVMSQTRGQCGNVENEKFRDAWAADLSILYVPPNHAGFIKTPAGTLCIPHSETPYVLNKRDGFEFISSIALDQRVCLAADNSYSIVSLQQPGEFVVFKDGAMPLIWEYSSEHPELNTIHLSNAFFSFNGRVENNASEVVRQDQLTVFIKPANKIVVLEDDSRNIRFLEQSGNQPIVLREPWRYISSMPKSDTLMRFGEPGTEVVRVLPSDAEWVVVKNLAGQVEFFPPPLDGSAYYFYQPKYAMVGLVNRNQPGEQRFDVPGVGPVTIVNIETGQIGLCQIKNMNFFLSPSPQPYVFMPPNRFFKAALVDESYVRVGDLHRIYLRPDERCVVEKNGRAILLPDSNAEETLEAEETNGVYTFRAEKLSVDGPVKKSQKSYKLGPFEFFNVDVGEVAYGNKNGAVYIWHQGEHFVNNNRNEWFKGFFSTNVDPVIIENFDITSKHGVTSHIDIYVTYSIDDADKAIKRFRTHDELHAFIMKTTESEILQLCSTQPPIGYTEGDFTTTQSASAPKQLDREQEGAEAMKEIESQFAQRASTLLHKYGIELGDMHITRWVIDPEFVKTSRDLALGLQSSRADLEQKQIGFQQQEVENRTEMLRLEKERQKAVTDAQTQAEVQAAQEVAKANAERAKAVAQAQRETQVAEAKAHAELASKKTGYEAQTALAESQTKIAEEKIKQREAERREAAVTNQIRAEKANAGAQERKTTAVLDAETKAFSETAGRRAEAEADQQTAAASLEAARMDAERMVILAEARAQSVALEGKANAAVLRSEVEAKYPGASGDMLIRLEIARIEMETRQRVAENTQMVVHTRDPESARKTFDAEVDAAHTYRDAFGMNNPAAMMMYQAGQVPPMPTGPNPGLFSLNGRMSHMPAAQRDPAETAQVDSRREAGI